MGIIKAFCYGFRELRKRHDLLGIYEPSKDIVFMDYVPYRNNRYKSCIKTDCDLYALRLGQWLAKELFESFRPKLRKKRRALDRKLADLMRKEFIEQKIKDRVS